MARRALRSFSEGGLKGYGEFRHPFQDALRLAAGKLHSSTFSGQREEKGAQEPNAMEGGTNMMRHVGLGGLTNKLLPIVLAVCFCSIPRQVCCQSDHSPGRQQSSPESTQNKKYQFSFDWVTQNTTVWDKVLSPFRDKPRVHYLEIGVFEGRSLIWMLENILTDPTSRATCIDIFPRDLEHTFLANLKMSGFAWKTTIIKGYSQVELRKLPFSSFDIIYIDGSHRAPDVLADAVFSWPLLKKGGVFIFDDYQWMKGKFPPQERPELAINSFVGTYVDYIDTVHTGHQFIVKKTGYADWEH